MQKFRVSEKKMNYLKTPKKPVKPGKTTRLVGWNTKPRHHKGAGGGAKIVNH